MPLGSTPPATLSVPDAPPRALPATDDGLYPLVYDELKRLAHRHLRARGGTPTISTTELVHETFLKLDGGGAAAWDGRAHFFGTASRAMRQVLVDFARRRQTAKRGGALRRVSLSDVAGTLDVQLDEILALDVALQQLDAVDDRLRRVVELRFFAGLPVRDVAETLGVTTRTVERDWLKARLFLLRELEQG